MGVYDFRRARAASPLASKRPRRGGEGSKTRVVRAMAGPKKQKKQSSAPSKKKQQKEQKDDADLMQSGSDEEAEDVELMPAPTDAQGEYEEEEEDAAPPGESEIAKERRLKASRRNARKNARQRCYRAWAKKIGAGDVTTSGELANDILTNALSLSDINRMATWAPECVEIGSSLEEFKLMLAQRDERLGESAAHVLRTNVEGLARNIMLELAERCFETTTGPQTIGASQVRSLLRPYERVMEVSTISPDGLVRFGQMKKKTKVVTMMTPDGRVNKVEETDQTIIPATADDADEIAAERRFARANHLKYMKERDKERDVLRAKKKELREANKRATAPAAAVEAA